MLRSAFLLAVALPALAQSPDTLDFAGGLNDYRNLRQMLPGYLQKAAYARLEERKEAVDRLSGAAGIASRRALAREGLIRALGGLPERTPLNAHTVATIDRGQYKIEKVIFESRPRFYVTANLYLPTTGRPPYPAILYPLGHENGAKAHETWQQMLGSLASKGYAALAWDPVGQGERVQLWDPDLAGSKAGASTNEHSTLGIQCLLTGQSLAQYTVWDGIRALDYLLSRPEVDAKRVGCTGNSGGGTHTAYLSAIDDRIQVAAASCYLTSWRRLLETIGPQDAEQVLLPWIAEGLDHPDFIYATGGKPYLILSAIRDFFSITGARETYAEAHRMYESAGAADKIMQVEADDGHGYSKPRRMAAYRWFGKWLKGAEDNEPEPEVRIAAEDELNATPTGQVATSLGGETVHSLNAKRAADLRKLRKPGDLRARIVKLTAFSAPAGKLEVRTFGEIRRAGYRIEKLIYQSEPGISIPALLFVPEGGAAKKPGVVWVHGRGKSADATRGGDIERLAQADAVVLAIDARGFGETRTEQAAQRDASRPFGDYNSAMTALLLSRTLVGMRMLDIERGVDLLAARMEVDPARIAAVGKETGAIAVLHSAAIDARIRKVALEGMLRSYQAVVDAGLHRGVLENVIPGVLAEYDLPDVAASLARPLWIMDAAGPVGQQAPLDEVRKEYQAARAQVLRREPNQFPYIDLVR